MFVARAAELSQLLQNAWMDYEHTALQVHALCRTSRNTTRQEFRATYEYIMASGLQLESVQCSPNVTHAERAAYEAEARQYYSEHYPSIDYQGIIGFVNKAESEVDNATEHRQEQDLVIVPSLERPFYFPVHYLDV